MKRKMPQVTHAFPELHLANQHDVRNYEKVTAFESGL
jgi:hypothetical protein